MYAQYFSRERKIIISIYSYSAFLKQICVPRFLKCHNANKGTRAHFLPISALNTEGHCMRFCSEFLNQLHFNSLSLFKLIYSACNANPHQSPYGSDPEQVSHVTLNLNNLSTFFLRNYSSVKQAEQLT